MDIYEYVDKYGDYTFEEKKFNEIDNLVFCSLAYLDFTYTSVNVRDHTLEYIGQEYLKNNNYKEVRRLGISQRDAYKLIRKVIKKKRYKDIIIHDYVYVVDINKQFSAMMFRINNNLEYICFEGTDEFISGWKEDFEFSYKFPVPSQKDAIKYANKHIKIKGPNVIIGGHSKGGNLALVAGMYTKRIKQFKILKVYSNDGPGLKNKEFESKEYKRIRKKFIHFVPDFTIVGVILKSDRLDFIKTTKKNFLSHAIAYWVVEDDHLVKTKLSKKSSEFMNNLDTWLKNHTDSEKQAIVESFFKVFEESKIEKYTDLNNIENIKKIINNIRNVDKHSKDLLIDLIKYNFLDIKNK